MQAQALFVGTQREVEAYFRNRKLWDFTKVKGPTEKAIKKVLLELRPSVDVYYHVFPFPVSEFCWHRPDFLVPQIQVDGKYLVLDPHHFMTDETGKATKEEVATWSGFRMEWGKDFYQIMISSNRKRKLKWQTDLGLGAFADEAWRVPNHGSNSDEIVPVIKKRLRALTQNGKAVAPSYSKEVLVECLIRAERLRITQEELFAELRDRSLVFPR